MKKFIKLSSLAVLALAIGQSASALTMWGQLKNAFNDCEYTEQEHRVNYQYEVAITPKLPDHFSGFFSESDFYTKPWMREFAYVIVVNKATEGINAQTMRIYEYGYKIREVKISTGREGFELRRKNKICAGAPPKSYWSQTPTGFYTPKFLEEEHVSSSWDSNMPYAIFFDIENGLALHEVPETYIDRLGTRASGGCVRQDGETAEFLFKKVRATEGYTVPEVNLDGTPVLDQNGQVKHINSQLITNKKTKQTTRFYTYSALIIIEE